MFVFGWGSHQEAVLPVCLKSPDFQSRAYTVGSPGAHATGPKGDLCIELSQLGRSAKTLNLSKPRDLVLHSGFPA